MSQRILLGVALAAGLLAGGLYYAGSQRVGVLVAARDLDALHPLSADDVALRDLPPDALPEGAVSEVERVMGLTPRAPLTRGQFILAAGLGDQGATFRTGLAVPRGSRAVAVPLSPAQAVGGALPPGALVDVIAVPTPGRAPAGRVAEVVATAALVLDVRAESGAALGLTEPSTARSGSSPLVERLGSIVVAIPAAEELRIADRIATSTFVVALVAR